MKNLLTKWETEEINRKIASNVQLIDREPRKSQIRRSYWMCIFPKAYKIDEKIFQPN